MNYIVRIGLHDRYLKISKEEGLKQNKEEIREKAVNLFKELLDKWLDDDFKKLG